MLIAIPLQRLVLGMLSLAALSKAFGGVLKGMRSALFVSLGVSSDHCAAAFKNLIQTIFYSKNYSNA